jgi:hypothetical protein
LIPDIQEIKLCTMQGAILNIALLYFLFICALYFSTCSQLVDAVYSLKKVCE